MSLFCVHRHMSWTIRSKLMLHVINKIIQHSSNEPLVFGPRNYLATIIYFFDISCHCNCHIKILIYCSETIYNYEIPILKIIPEIFVTAV